MFNINTSPYKIEKINSSPSFGSKITQTASKVITDKSIQIASTASAALGTAFLLINLDKNKGVENDSIKEIVASCKNNDDKYDLTRLKDSFIYLKNMKGADIESKIIIQLIKFLGDLDILKNDYPEILEFIAKSIEENEYKDKETQKDLIDDFNSNPSITDERLSIYSEYLKNGYEVDKYNFIELHNKSASLGYLPKDCDNFKNYSFDMKNKLIGLMNNLLCENKIDESSALSQFCEILPEKTILKIVNNPKSLLNIEDTIQLIQKSYINKIFEEIYDSNKNLTEQDNILLNKHFINLTLLKLFEPEKFEQITDDELYSIAIKDSRLFPLLDNIKIEENYNPIDIKKKLSEIENDINNKLNNSKLIDKSHCAFIISKFRPNDKDIDFITHYVDNCLDENLMQTVLNKLYLFNDKNDSKEKMLRLIKYTSKTPEIVKFFHKTVGYNIPIISSGLKMIERTKNTNLLELLIEKRVPIEEWELIFNCTNKDNINSILKYLNENSSININELNKRLLLRNTECIHHFSEEEIFSAIKKIEKDIKYPVKVKAFKTYASLLDLKLFNPEKYNQIKKSGYFKLITPEPNFIRALHLLNPDSDINSNLAKDLDAICNNKSSIIEFEKNMPIKQAFSKSNCGDVVAIGDQLYINNGKTLIKWEMSKEKYLELFPPALKYSQIQAENGACYLISSISSIMNNPKSRAQIYQSFKQEGNDIIVTIKAYEDYFGSTRFENGNLPWNKDSKLHLIGAKGLQMLEYAYARATLRIKQDESFIGVESDSDPEIIMKRLESGNHNIAMSELLGLDFGDISDIENNTKKIVTDFIIDKNEVDVKDELEDYLIKYGKNDNYIIHFGIPMTDKIDPKIKKQYNLIPSHGYSILGYDEKNKIVKISNPHNSGITTKIPLDKLAETSIILTISSL